MNTTFTKPKRLKNKNTFLFLLPPPRMLRRASFLLIIFLLSSAFSCKEDPPVIPPPPPPVLKDTLTLAVADVTHRSASLNVQCTMNNIHSLVRLYRLFNSNETLVAEFPITIQDTTIIDDNNGTGLQLNTNYFYYAVRIDTLGERKDTSNIIEAATLDTTSHNYTWQEFVIGEWQSALYDVWGTDENNVWACGGVTINDSVHGLLHWNGVEWTPKGRGGGYAMYGFAADDIWTVGGSIFHYDGQNWNEVIDSDPILLANIPYTTVWGTSSSNLYLGNAWGKIIHWDGSKASVLVDFGVSITNINGTAQNDIWITGEKPSVDDALIVRYDGLNFNRLNYYPPYKFPMNTIYPLKNKELYIGGDGVYKRNGNQWMTEDVDKSKGSIYKIRGTNTNNLFAVGAYGVVHHYNGISWRWYNELYTPDGGINQSVFVTENKVFVVGINNDHISAKILIGQKN